MSALIESPNLPSMFATLRRVALNAICQVVNGNAICSCMHDYSGDPYVICKPECILSTDCPSNLACLNMKCLDPCPGTCGVNAICTVVNHRPICKCTPGYTGDPFSYCTHKRKFIQVYLLQVRTI